MKFKCSRGHLEHLKYSKTIRWLGLCQRPHWGAYRNLTLISPLWALPTLFPIILPLPDTFQCHCSRVEATCVAMESVKLVITDAVPLNIPPAYKTWSNWHTHRQQVFLSDLLELSVPRTLAVFIVWCILTTVQFLRFLDLSENIRLFISRILLAFFTVSHWDYKYHGATYSAVVLLYQCVRYVHLGKG